MCSSWTEGKGRNPSAISTQSPWAGSPRTVLIERWTAPIAPESKDKLSRRPSSASRLLMQVPCKTTSTVQSRVGCWQVIWVRKGWVCLKMGPEDKQKSHNGRKSNDDSKEETKQHGRNQRTTTVNRTTQTHRQITKGSGTRQQTIQPKHETWAVKEASQR